MSPPSNKRQKLSKNEYTGYVTKPNDKIDEIENETSPIEFFKNYISKRKPVKFNKQYFKTCSTNSDGVISNLSKFKFKNLLNTLNYNEDINLQIEEKFQGGFGLGKKRQYMNIIELFDELENGERDIYLTTQYKIGNDNEDNDEDDKVRFDKVAAELDDEEEEEDDEDEDDEQIKVENMSNTSSIDMNNLKDDFDDIEDDYEEEEDNDDNIHLEKQIEYKQRIEELYQPPLTNLANSSILPTNPTIIPKLITQQINLWMGKISTNTKFDIDLSSSLESLNNNRSIPSNGTSSGLHHDHADNLYILVQGLKRFTIFSPIDCENLFTVGKIFKIFNNGIIDYDNSTNSNWKSIRDDGAIIEEILHWEKAKATDPKEIERLDELIAKHEEQQKLNKDEKEKSDSSISNDPPSFSKIPPALLHLDEISDPKIKQHLVEFANKYFPGFLKLNKMTVWLYPGEMLYLPAGWFHEVSSFGDDDNDEDEEDNESLKDKIEKFNEKSSNIHIALNYWFIPPNNLDFNKPYQDSYWEEDWKITKDALNELGKNMHS
ncbi:uncharacterized protein KGF55_002138 [Candida pseudojiufengensis]|uniref:uncharacterized protein n=1 Tax=Candida pseudojiufengensis TaxID=497109 RepID=UPI0022249275|nr:uncharacterized protein KGF55_002138 [Candida pseudojiufengensis]KAI5964196.1 hypothetical protein KGF55_002138 [Candida pseudojiufengensis]